MSRRIRALGLAGVREYHARLMADEGEWARLDARCRIPISRFWRDRKVFNSSARDVLPALATVRAWSAGCARGAAGERSRGEFSDDSVAGLIAGLVSGHLAWWWKNCRNSSRSVVMSSLL